MYPLPSQRTRTAVFQTAFHPHPVRHYDNIVFRTLGEPSKEISDALLDVAPVLALIRLPQFIFFRHSIVELHGWPVFLGEPPVRCMNSSHFPQPYHFQPVLIITVHLPARETFPVAGRGNASQTLLGRLPHTREVLAGAGTRVGERPTLRFANIV